MTDLQALADSLRQDYGVPGLAMAVRQGNDLTCVASGLRKFDAPDRVTLEDKFHLGSCGKALTAAVFHHVMRQYKWNADTTIAEILPTIKKSRDADGITLVDLLTHLSGLPANYKGMAKFYTAPPQQQVKDIRFDVMCESLIRFRKPQQKKFDYSNLGYIILAALLEQATGESFEAYVRSHIFEKLALPSAGFGAAASNHPGLIDQPWGHTQATGQIQSLNEDNLPAHAPAGGMHANCADWTFFLQHLLCKDRIFDRPSQEVEVDGPDYIYTEHGLWRRGLYLWHDGNNTLNWARQIVDTVSGTIAVMATNIDSDKGRQALDALTDAVMPGLL